MCACFEDFTCSKCVGTPQDWRYFEDEPETERDLPSGREPDGRWEPWL